MFILKKKKECKVYKITDDTMDVFIETGEYNNILNCLLDHNSEFKCPIKNSESKNMLIDFINNVNDKVQLKDVTPLETVTNKALGGELFDGLDNEEIQSFGSLLPIICFFIDGPIVSFFIEISKRLESDNPINSCEVIGESNNYYYNRVFIDGSCNFFRMKKLSITTYKEMVTCNVI